MVIAAIVCTALSQKPQLLYLNCYKMDGDSENSYADEASPLNSTTVAIDQEIRNVKTKTRSRHTFKSSINKLTEEIQSEYHFRLCVNGRSYEKELNILNSDGTLPELEIGYKRIFFGSDTEEENVALWMGALNTLFILVLDSEENR